MFLPAQNEMLELNKIKFINEMTPGLASLYKISNMYLDTRACGQPQPQMINTKNLINTDAVIKVC